MPSSKLNSGLNLWDEFDRVRVLDFLRQLFSQNRLLQQVLETLLLSDRCPLQFQMAHLTSPPSKLYYVLFLKGLSGSNTGLGHALVPVAGDQEKLDTGNFRS